MKNQIQQLTSINFEIDEIYTINEKINLCLVANNSNKLIWIEGIKEGDLLEFIFETYKSEFPQTLSENDLYDTVTSHYSIDKYILKDYIIQKITEFEQNNEQHEAKQVSKSVNSSKARRAA